MIKMESHLGSIEISEQYFLSLIGSALADAFGVAGLSSAGRRRRGAAAGDSVRIGVRGNKLVIDLHILVTYGVNIAAVVSSIAHKISYTVEDATGIGVAAVNVFVDGMSAH